MFFCFLNFRFQYLQNYSNKSFSHADYLKEVKMFEQYLKPFFSWKPYPDKKFLIILLSELQLHYLTLRAFIGVETAALTFRTKQYKTGRSSHICYGKQFCNDFFLYHNTVALVHNCLRNYSAVWSSKKNQLSLTVSFHLEKVPFINKSCRFFYVMIVQ